MNKCASVLSASAMVALATLASGQAVTGFTGGTQFGIFHGASTGDVIGWTFSVNQDIFVTDLGVWNQDTQVGQEGLTSPHQVGIWNATTQALLGSTTVGPGGTVVGAFTYESIANITLVTGQQYVIGAMYTATDGDSYISGGVSNFTTSPDVNWLDSRRPSFGDLGFAFPDTTSVSIGRFGPNFLYTPVPTPGAAVALGTFGLLATRRRR